ncbi:hypothetical protein OH802_21365 [Nocardioides sp. NBC_00850]|uniref:hypothetical protein n=1 Tax=Nocardioides sp. NBC_00850 TaxID=2976001 RepID=UPI0038646313|nr:hypothetical protein OH802_21365 [Nocardioides sp. NBC_00850]
MIEKIHRYHERFRHQVVHVQADASGLTEQQHRNSLEFEGSCSRPAPSDLF